MRPVGPTPVRSRILLRSGAALGAIALLLTSGMLSASTAFGEPPNFGQVTQRIQIEPDTVEAILSRDGSSIFVIEPADPNRQPGHVRVIDVASGSELERIRVGAGPNGAALSARGNHLYVTNGLGRSVSVIDTNDLVVERTIRLASAPRNPVISADGNRLYVQLMSGTASNRIAVINTRSRRLLRTLSVRDADGAGCDIPWTPALTLEGTLLVPCNNDLVQVPVSGRPSGVLANLCEGMGTPEILGAGDRAWVPCGPDGWFIDPDNLTTISRIQYVDPGEVTTVGWASQAPPAISGNGARIYQPILQSGKLAVIDANAAALVTRLPITTSFGLSWFAPLLSPDDARLYLPLQDATGTLVAVNTLANVEVGRIPLGANSPQPRAIMRIENGTQLAVAMSIGELVKVSLLPR